MNLVSRKLELNSPAATGATPSVVTLMIATGATTIVVTLTTATRQTTTQSKFIDLKRRISEFGVSQG